jgi:hypothetical protein
VCAARYNRDGRSLDHDGDPAQKTQLFWKLGGKKRAERRLGVADGHAIPAADVIGEQEYEAYKSNPAAGTWMEHIQY